MSQTFVLCWITYINLLQIKNNNNGRLTSGNTLTNINCRLREVQHDSLIFTSFLHCDVILKSIKKSHFYVN